VGDAVISVLLADGHDVVRVGVRTVLLRESDIEIVGEARTAAEARPLIATLRPDVLILDAHLPDSSGVALCREALAMKSDIRCMILTTDADDEVMSQAIMAGAAGYVLKQIEATSLVSGVRLVASGHTLFDPEAAAKVVHNVEERRRMHEVVAELTPQQRRILVLLAEGISNRQIADRLVLAEKTVKNHINNIYGKLRLNSRYEAITRMLGQRRAGEAGNRETEKHRPGCRPQGGGHEFRQGGNGDPSPREEPTEAAPGHHHHRPCHQGCVHRTRLLAGTG
jgi:two-component system, NarL family, response regulator DevR